MVTAIAENGVARMTDDAANAGGEVTAASAIPAPVERVPSLRTVYQAHYDFVFRTLRRFGVEDALVDMYVLAEAEAFVANPASSFSGCVRDIRAARGRSLASTQVGVPPHDARAWKADLERKATRRKQRTAH